MSSICSSIPPVSGEDGWTADALGGLLEARRGVEALEVPDAGIPPPPRGCPNMPPSTTSTLGSTLLIAWVGDLDELRVLGGVVVCVLGAVLLVPYLQCLDRHPPLARMVDRVPRGPVLAPCRSAAPRRGPARVGFPLPRDHRCRRRARRSPTRRRWARSAPSWRPGGPSPLRRAPCGRLVRGHRALWHQAEEPRRSLGRCQPRGGQHPQNSSPTTAVRLNARGIQPACLVRVPRLRNTRHAPKPVIRTSAARIGSIGPSSNVSATTSGALREFVSSAFEPPS
jgi:hypothetical protein